MQIEKLSYSDHINSFSVVFVVSPWFPFPQTHGRLHQRSIGASRLRLATMRNVFNAAARSALRHGSKPRRYPLALDLPLRGPGSRSRRVGQTRRGLRA